MEIENYLGTTGKHFDPAPGDRGRRFRARRPRRRADNAGSFGTSASQTRTALHQDVELKASPERIDEILLDSKQFAGFSAGPWPRFHRKAGGAFSMFKGMIVGRTIDRIPSQRIVQAWCPTHSDPGFYLIVKFELKPQASGTMLALDHWGFPEGDYDHLFDGWNVE